MKTPPPYRAFLPLPIVFSKKQGQDALKKAIPPPAKRGGMQESTPLCANGASWGSQGMGKEWVLPAAMLYPSQKAFGQLKNDPFSSWLTPWPARPRSLPGRTDTTIWQNGTRILLENLEI